MGITYFPTEQVEILDNQTILSSNRNNLFALCAGGFSVPGNYACFAGGYDGAWKNVIDYISMNTTANAQDFGDTTNDFAGNTQGTSNGTHQRGIYSKGYKDLGLLIVSDIDYITINTTGNAQDLGDLSVVRSSCPAVSNGINQRAIFSGGSLEGGSRNDTIDYLTINVGGTCQDFGNLFSGNTRSMASCSNQTNERGVISGGFISANTNIIQYFTINSPGDAQDLGDLSVTRRDLTGCSNGRNERGISIGGYTTTYSNVIDYFTINSSGNATDFGDALYNARQDSRATSNMTHERGIYGGGFGGAYEIKIEYITINSPSNGATFGNLFDSRFRSGAMSNA